MGKYNKTCPVCQVSFAAKRPSKVYCSRLCYNKYYGEKNKERIKRIAHSYYESNKEEILIRTKDYYEKHKDAHNKWQRDWYTNNKDYHNSRIFEKHYGLTPKDKQDLINAQNGECAICGIALKDNRPHIDHCHETGKIRAILCHWCNIGIGCFEDNVEWLQSAIYYLNHHRSKK